MTAARLLLSTALSAATAACGGPRHVQPFTPHERSYNPGAYAQKEAAAKPSNGSLFSEANPGYLEDTRAVRVGDFVIVRINETADAQGDSSTNLSRDGSMSMGVDAMLGIVPALKKAYPDLDPKQLVAFASKAGFIGSGATQRKGQLTGDIAVRVVKEMPNGDLFIEGTKVEMINNEEYHLYLSGLVRPTDIGQDNSIASTRIADAQIEFTGRGDLADQQRKGWLGRLLDTFNPL
jgi:flagellar L-ring protein precursor FlgH